MKTLSIQQMETVSGESNFSDFCAGFAGTRVGIAVAVKIGLIAAPVVGAGAAPAILAIDVACAAEWFS